VSKKTKKNQLYRENKKKINWKIQTGKTKKKLNLDWFQFKVYKID
jgi:hypothetical protein